MIEIENIDELIELSKNELSKIVLNHLYNYKVQQRNSIKTKEGE